MYKLALLPCVFLLLIACSSQQQNNIDTANHNMEAHKTFIQHLWQVTSIHQTAIADHISITLKVGNNNNVTGKSGCNNYRSQLTINEQQLKFSQSISTMKACLPSLMTLESNYLKAIELSEKYQINSTGQLNFYDAKGNNTLTFNRVKNAHNEITGSVFYRERIALPPNAILTVNLLDISLMDAPAKVIATKEYKLNGQQVPINFALQYLTANIDERHTYSVQAQIKLDGALLFTATSSHPVITRSAPKTVDILLEKVASLSIPKPQAKPRLVNYHCERNTSLSVAFTTSNTLNSTQQVVVINYGDSNPITLPQVPAASGFFYSNGKFSLRGKGDEVFWTVGKMRSLRCQAA